MVIFKSYKFLLVGNWPEQSSIMHKVKFSVLFLKAAPNKLSSSNLCLVMNISFKVGYLK